MILDLMKEFWPRHKNSQPLFVHCGFPYELTVTVKGLYVPL